MIPKEAIKKAIEGGWKKEIAVHYTDFTSDDEEVAFGNPDTEEVITWGHEQVALDPSFWQSLGKALGRKKKRNFGFENDWHSAATQFYDLILTGGDTKTFWDGLLTPLEPTQTGA